MQNTTPQFVSHPAGTLTTGSVLDVGLKCTHSCAFCYYSYLDKSDNQFQGMRQAKFRTHDECRSILHNLKENGFTHFDYTGGEPTLHPNIVDLTRYAHQELGLRGRMITLGQFLMRKLPSCKNGGLLIEELLDAGLTNFLFSTHATEEALFKRITGESWERLKAAMNYLDSKNFYYTSNTTVFEWNMEALPEIAHEILQHKVYMHNFIIMNAYYEWNQDGRAFGVQAKYSEVYPHLKKAIDLLQKHNVAVNVRYAPLCSLPGLEKHLVGGVGVRYDAYEWMNVAGHMGGSPELCASKLKIDSSGVDEDWIYVEEKDSEKQILARRGGVKVFPENCQTCKARSACDGVDPKYLKLYGASEFKPYEDDFIVGPVIPSRRKYTPAFQLKWDQWADMASVMKNSFEGQPSDQNAPPVTIAVKHENLPGLSEQIVAAEKRLLHGEAFGGDNVLIHVDPLAQEVSPELVLAIKESLVQNPEAQILFADAYALADKGVSFRPSPKWAIASLMMGWPLSSVIAIRPGVLREWEVRALLEGKWSIRDVAVTAFTRNLRTAHLGRPLAVMPKGWGNEMKAHFSGRREWKKMLSIKGIGRSPLLITHALRKIKSGSEARP